MKIQVFILPKDGEVQSASDKAIGPASAAGTSPGKAQRVSALKIPWKLTALSLLLVCIFIVCGMAGHSAYNAISAMDELTVRHSAPVTSGKQDANLSAHLANDKSRVQLFDKSQQLRRGDVVVVRQKNGADVGQVTGTANSTGVVKRGSNVEALYLLGKDRYLVTSEGRTTVVHGHDILATVASPSARGR